MELKEMRTHLDALDSKILKLLNERAQISKSIGRYKKKKKKAYYAPDRERKLLDRLHRLNRGPLTGVSLDAIYREIMSSSLSIEKQLRIAFLGPRLTFTHQASVSKFGKSVQYVPCASIADVFLEVEHDRCDYGVVPVENSTEGAVYHTLDSFIESDLKICSEIILNIQLHFMSREKRIERIRKVYSHPQVFGQCRQWLEAHLPNANLCEASSTMDGARRASKELRASCIASEIAAEIYHLPLVAKSIQDRIDNVTRFLVISKEIARPTRRDKTSIMISLKDRVGALHEILKPFSQNRINLSKIESRPSKRKNWQYYFFVDFESHVSNPRAKKAIRSLGSRCRHLKILGSYPKAK